MTTAPPEVGDPPTDELTPIAGWAEAWEGELASGSQAEPTPTRSRPRLRQRVVVLVLIVGACVGLFLLFDGPIATAWYQARQRALASDLEVGRPKVSRGQTLATMQIPKIGLNVYVVQGDAPEELRGGPGHRVGTPDPGRKGNSLVFAHHNAWGGPFKKLGKLHRGDVIFVQRRGDQEAFTYLVRSVRTVPESDRRLLAPSTDFRMTLVTGSGGRLSSERVVVTAVSGSPGKLRRPPASLRAETASRVGLVSTLTGLTVLAFAFAGGAFVWLRKRRYAMLGIAIVVVPLTAAGLLGVYLKLDSYLPLLR